MAAAMTAVLSGSFGAGINISMGPLAGCCTVSEAVTAPIQQYVDTQQQCLADVVCPSSLTSPPRCLDEPAPVSPMDKTSQMYGSLARHPITGFAKNLLGHSLATSLQTVTVQA